MNFSSLKSAFRWISGKSPREAMVSDSQPQTPYQVLVDDVVKSATVLEIFENVAFDNCIKNLLEASIATVWMIVQSFHGLDNRKLNMAAEFAIELSFESWSAEYSQQELANLVQPLFRRRMDQYSQVFVLRDEEQPQTPILRLGETIVENVIGEKEPHIAQILAVSLIGWKTISMLGAELNSLDQRGLVNWVNAP